MIDQDGLTALKGGQRRRPGRMALMGWYLTGPLTAMARRARRLDDL